VVSNISSGAGIGGGLGAAGLAEHALDLGHGLDQRSVCCSSSPPCRRQAGQRRGHVQQVAFVQLRHELAAQPLIGHRLEAEDQPAITSVSLGSQHPVERRAVDARSASG
jgi:hypothetical protein